MMLCVCNKTDGQRMMYWQNRMNFIQVVRMNISIYCQNNLLSTINHVMVVKYEEILALQVEDLIDLERMMQVIRTL